MILLTVQWWRGPSSKLTLEQSLKIDSKIELLGFVSRMKLKDAIIRLRRYEDAFNSYSSALAFTYKIVAVSEIDDLDEDAIEMAGMELLDTKQFNAEDFADA